MVTGVILFLVSRGRSAPPNDTSSALDLGGAFDSHGGTLLFAGKW